LHPRENGRADGTAEGIPYLVVEPGEELFVSIFVEVLLGGGVGWVAVISNEMSIFVTLIINWDQ
jgi:hypothetical protein